MIFGNPCIIAIVAQNGIGAAIHRNFIDIFEAKTFLGILGAWSKIIVVRKCKAAYRSMFYVVNNIVPRHGHRN